MKRLLLLLSLSGLCLAQIGTFGNTNQQAVTATAAVVSIPAGLATVCVKAMPTNSAVVYVGASSAVTTSTGYPLSASESVCVPVSGGQRVYVVAASTGSNIAWLGTVQ